MAGTQASVQALRVSFFVTSKLINHSKMLTAILAVFIIGYLAIALEHPLHINKAASALLIGVLCWTLYAISLDQLLPADKIPEWFSAKAGGEHTEHLNLEYMLEGQLGHALNEIAQILFFLMGAMTIVELVDAHEGFALVTNRIRAKKTITLLWIVSLFSFFLSAVLDNLTTTIVMVSLLRKLVHDKEMRRFFVGMVVIAANAGGAWSVIGDVTTTMLWVKHKIGTVEVMVQLFLASLTCLVVPLLVLSRTIKGDLSEADISHSHKANKKLEPWHQALFLTLGLAGLLSVPVFKAYTHLPPYMGMMLALGILWMASELTSHTMDEYTRSSTGVLAVLQRIDMSSVLFFFGILLAVSALGAVGLLTDLASFLDKMIPSRALVAVVIGLASAVIDNVPLVAAGIEMYDIPANNFFWMMLAYCAGTGGSCLIIGSAAGVAAMGLEKIDFVWYLKKIAPWALLGYLSGICVYWIQAKLTGAM